MKKIFLLLMVNMVAQFCKAQTIVAAEYFINADPGVGNGVPIVVSTPGANVNLVTSIPTSTLPNGFHIVSIRTKQNDGQWGLYEKAGFYISSSASNAPNIVAAEYFIDTDPGVGNGIPITLTAGTNVNFVAPISTASLTQGFHFVAIRTRNANGNWGLFEKAGFYISTSTSNVSNIVAAEFFIDTDPGVGNGTAITPITAGSNPTFVATIPTTSLTPGFHFVAIRTRDADGRWGMYENRGFYISNSASNVTNIVAAEFFIDTDPGVGNGTAITPLTVGANVTFVASIPTTSLSPGFHLVAIRTRDADGKWGMYENRGFYISTQTTNSAGMTDAEYFIDVDPGVGNGTPFSIPGGQSFHQNFALPIPIGTSQGQHFIGIRVKNDWGLFAFDTITVDGIVTPLRLLSFTGQKKNAIAALKWITENEVNTAHFEIERSKNGVTFEKIGRVNSNNVSGVHTYLFDDLQPIKGVNFYRLQQVDLDGTITYSPIIKLLFEAFGKPIQIYPNPAVEWVQFNFETNKNTILVNVYDAVGKLVLVTTLKNQSPMQLKVGSLPSGKYAIQLSDGEKISTGTFIKH